jgi:hypothetical protein
MVNEMMNVNKVKVRGILVDHLSLKSRRLVDHRWSTGGQPVVNQTKLIVFNNLAYLMSRLGGQPKLRGKNEKAKLLSQ